MNKHTLGYGLSTVLLAGTIYGSAYGLHKKNETIEGLKVDQIHLKQDIEVLNAEKEDVMSTNSQLSEEIEKLQQNFINLQENMKQIEGDLYKTNEENKRLKNELQAKAAAKAKAIANANAKGEWKTFTATYYDADYESTGKSPGDPDYGITASGEYVKEGVTIAVDPNVIPLGSWVEVKYPDGKVEKRKATDTGRVIKGNKIDIYIAKATLTSGKHPVEVRLLN